MANTTNYGFGKPDINGSNGSWGGILNGSLDSIDTHLHTVDTTASAALPQAGGTLTGIVNVKIATMARSNVGTSTGTITLDLSASQAFTVSLSGSAAFAFSNPASGSVAEGFLLRLTNGGISPAPSWPASVKWAGGSAPTFSTGVDLIAFVTFDNGTTYLGVLVAKDLR